MTKTLKKIIFEINVVNKLNIYKFDINRNWFVSSDTNDIILRKIRRKIINSMLNNVLMSAVFTVNCTPMTSDAI